MSLLYRQLADEMAEQIQRGLYSTGERLPGVRGLSTQRGVSVATAVAAYRQLEDQGFIEARDRSGFYVRTRPVARPVEAAPAEAATGPCQISNQALALAMIQAANEPGVLPLGAAVPDPRLLPTYYLERSLSKVLRRDRFRVASYMSPAGAPELRRQIARRLAEAGCSLAAHDVVITNGCQEALMLALRAVTQPGDAVALESPAFYGLLHVMESLGLKAVEIPSHPARGISIDTLAFALERWPVKACVLVPNYSNPLGYCMSDDHKHALINLLDGRGITLIEDDIYGDLGFQSRRPSLCRALSPGSDIITCGSFSKTLSPGLRAGWILPGRHQERIEHLKYVSSLANTSLSQLALADYLESGRYERYLRDARGIYASNVARMSEAIAHHFPQETRLTQPQGGFVLWVELPGEVDTLDLAQRALQRGVSIAPGPLFSPTGKYRSFLRISCAWQWEERLERGIKTLAKLIST